jgi:7-cyano-7-deazaguanine synthase
MDAKKAVVLLSGGLDSTTCLAIAKDMGFECHALSFDYGQRHKVELRRAKEVGAALGVASHVVVAFDLRAWGGSALTSDKIDVPDYGSTEGIPPTYVPARNTIFLSFATAYAETLAARDIFIGVNSLDYSGYPDCRPAFVEAFERCATLGTKAADEGWSFKIHAPLQKLRKTEIIERGRKLGVDYGITHSCYNPRPDGAPCGRCDSCQLRAKAFAELGLKDPALK